MSETPTPEPRNEIRVLARTRDGMVKTRIVAGESWAIQFFPSEMTMHIFAETYDFTVVDSREPDDDESDNG